MIDQVRLLSFPRKNDASGSVSMIESCNHTPFSIKRVGYLYDFPSGGKRDGFAYRGQEQVLIALSGAVEVIIDDGVDRREYRLNTPCTGLYIPGNIWTTLEHFSGGAVLMMLGSNKCPQKGYIDQYRDFLTGVGESLEAVAFNDRFLEHSWEWLNLPENSKALHFSEFQTKSEQIEWYEQLSRRGDLHIWGITCNDHPVGVIELRGVNGESASYYSYLAGEVKHHELFLRWMIQKGEEMAGLMNLSTLYIELLTEQTELINFYIHQGYLIETINGNEVRISKEVAIEELEV